MDSKLLRNERAFTLYDVSKRIRASKKKILKTALCGALLFGGLSLLTPAAYKAEALFKEGGDSGSSEVSLMRDLLPLRRGQESQATIMLKSLPVLKRAVSELGLQATVQKEKPWLWLRVLKRARNNLRALRQKPLLTPPSFRFSNVSYEGRVPLSYLLKIEGEKRYSIWKNPHTRLAEGAFGQPVRFQDICLTLEEVPESAPLKKFLPLSIEPWIEIAKGLRSTFTIEMHKQNKLVCLLEMRHPDPLFAQNFLNAVMKGYQDHLETEFEEVSQKQIAYLDKRQREFYEKVDLGLEEKAAYLSQNIEEGLIPLGDGAGTLGAFYQELSQRQFSLDLSLGRLKECLEKGKLPSGFDPLFEENSALLTELESLRQQRDLLELSLEATPRFPSLGELQARREELEEIRHRREKAGLWAEAFEQGIALADVPEGDSLFTQEGALLSLFEKGLKNKDDALRCFQEHLHLLALREKVAEERLLHETEDENFFEGMDLETLRSLFVQYSKNLDQEETSARHYETLLAALPQEDFSLSALGNVLADPLSKELIEKAAKTLAKLKDEAHCSEKEAQRGREEIGIQKKILKDHLEELSTLANLRISLLQGKMRQIQKGMLHCIRRSLGVREAKMADWLTQMERSLQAEDALLKTKMARIKQAMQKLPEREKIGDWMKIRLEAAHAMMQGLTQLSETKTLNFHLRQAAAYPLEKATATPFPVPPPLLPFSLAGAFCAGIGALLTAILRGIQKGFPASLPQLKELQYPVAGRLSSRCDGPEAMPLAAEDRETLRALSLFLDQGSFPKTAALIEGKGADYSYALAELLNEGGLSSVLIRFDFSAKYQKEDVPGLFSYFQDGAPLSSLLRKGKGFDFIPAGGSTPRGAEWLRSPLCKALLEELKARYPLVLLVLRGPLEHAEARGALRLADQAVVTAVKEPLEALTPFLSWDQSGDFSRLQILVQEDSYA